MKKKQRKPKRSESLINFHFKPLFKKFHQYSIEESKQKKSEYFEKIDTDFKSDEKQTSNLKQALTFLLNVFLSFFALSFVIISLFLDNEFLKSLNSVLKISLYVVFLLLLLLILFAIILSLLGIFSKPRFTFQYEKHKEVMDIFLPGSPLFGLDMIGKIEEKLGLVNQVDNRENIKKWILIVFASYAVLFILTIGVLLWEKLL